MLVNSGKYYLYRHIRHDKNEVFYIGIGTKIKYFNCFENEYRRAFSKFRENRIWNSIIKKSTYIVEIICESNDYSFIKIKEREFVKFYGRKCNNSGTLANFTEGGEGNTGYVPTEESKRKSRESNLGKKRTEATKQNIRKARAKQNMDFVKKKVLQYTLKEEFIKDFPGIIDAVKETNQKSDSNITAVCKGTRKSAGGYKWKYSD